MSHHVLLYRLFEPMRPGYDDENSIRSDVKYGHTYHCAARMVWGDGECECGLLEREENEDRWASTDPAWDDFE